MILIDKKKKSKEKNQLIKKLNDLDHDNRVLEHIRFRKNKSEEIELKQFEQKHFCKINTIKPHNMKIPTPVK